MQVRAAPIQAIARPVDKAWTIRRVLAWTAEDFAGRGIDTSRLDAELLVAHALGLGRVQLYMDLDRPLTDAERGAIRALVMRRRKREPIAYIVGKKELWGRSFIVTPAVLVPRPDSETLIERALEVVAPDARVLDLCTGSGILGITVAAERPEVHADLTDLSADALEVARQNAEALGVIDRVRLLRGDLFEVLGDERYSLIIANPPYIPEAEVAGLAPDVRDHEPHLALVGGADGFAVHRRIIADAPRFLSPGGTLLMEVGAGQAPELERLIVELGWAEHTARHRDLGGIERVVEARLRSCEGSRSRAGS